MKKIIFLFMMFAAFDVQAATNKLLIVVTNDGNKVSFDLSSNPVITFTGQVMQINSTFLSQDFEITNVAKYFFENSSTSFKELEQGELRISYSDRNQLSIDGLQQSSSIRLYSVDGKEIPGCISTSDDKVVVNLISLPKGIYIISANNSQNFKIYKR